MYLRRVIQNVKIQNLIVSKMPLFFSKIRKLEHPETRSKMTDKTDFELSKFDCISHTVSSELIEPPYH